ncbi:MAG: HAD hydrolase family protein [Planctomycetota bacterium]|nr:HAD hydrolase family protein [Planctomycetota bacterium]
MPDDDAARRIRLLVLDVDGVLSDGLVSIDARGVETKAFHTRDGAGITIWRRLGHEVAIITGRSSMTVQHRADELGIRHVFQGVRNKMDVLGNLLNDLGLAASEAAVMGDDLPDLPMLRLAGYPIAVADAACEVRALAAFETERPGGQGAVREAIEHLLKAQDRWDEALALFD